MPTSAAMPQSSGADGSGVPPHGLDFYHCPKCRWRYPNRRPSAKKRRNHKKYCGEIAAMKSKGDQSSFAKEIDGEETILTVPNDDRLHLESDIEGRKESNSSMTMSCMEEHMLDKKETPSSSINSISASSDLDMGGLESPQTKLMDETKETSSKTTENMGQNPPLHDHRVIADALTSQSGTSNHTSLDILLSVVENETQQRISLSCSQQTSEIYATNNAPQGQDMNLTESPPLDGQISEVFARQSSKEMHTSLDCLLEAIDLIEVEEKDSLPCSPQSQDNDEPISFVNQIEVEDENLLPSSQTSKEIYTANDKSMSCASPHANSTHESEALPPNLKPISTAEIQEENMELSQPQSNFEINAATANQTSGKKIRTTLKSIFEENIEIEAEERSPLPNSQQTQEICSSYNASLPLTAEISSNTSAFRSPPGIKAISPEVQIEKVEYSKHQQLRNGREISEKGHTSLRSLLEKGISSPNRLPQVPECIGSRILTDDLSSEESCPLAVDGLAQEEWNSPRARKTRKGRLNWMTFFCCASLR